MHYSLKRHPIALSLLVALGLSGCDLDFNKEAKSPSASDQTTVVDNTDNTGNTIPEPLNDNYPAFEQRSLNDEIFYFVFVDRFSNGNTDNDNGDANTLSNASKDMTALRGFHGGDIQGVIDKLDYIQGMGVTALWLNPVLANRNDYHGYAAYDFLTVDPHFGTNADYKALVDAAHARNMKVYMDIVVNHTADIIFYEEGSSSYRDSSQAPYTPTTTAENANIKNPAWLNDLSNYHNRGSSTFAGESAILGDFFSLDDLATEKPEVRDGLIAIYKSWIEDYGVDGFRVDTVRHVNLDFWPTFVSEIKTFAAEQGKPNFSLFGEVFELSNSQFISQFTKQGQLPSALDFPMYSAIGAVFSRSDSVNTMVGLFNNDDLYTDADSSALNLTTFTGNHDEGRFGHALIADNVPASEQLPRTLLAHAFLYFARGIPVIYYGDEQGFIGGEDADGREDMFPSELADYVSNDLIGTDATPAVDNFDPTHPIYKALREYSTVYRAHSALRNGQQVASAAGNNLLAISRFETDAAEEYLIVFNNSTTTQTGTASALTPSATFSAVYPASAASVSSDATGGVAVEIAPLSFVVYKANSSIPKASTMSASLSSVTEGATLSGLVEVSAAVNADGLAKVDFYVQEQGGEQVYLGSDYNAPYRVFWDSTKTNTLLTNVTFSAQVDNLNGSQEPVSAVNTVIDNRVFDEVTVHYENGNNRAQAVLISDSGEAHQPVVIENNQVVLPLRASDSAFTLVFEDESEGTFTFDQPVYIELDTLRPQLDANASALEIYVNNSLDVSLTDNFTGTGTPATLTSDPNAAAPFGDTTLYVRGAMNGWEASADWQLTYQGNNTYKASSTLTQASFAYKFADADWTGATNFGGAFEGSGLVAAANSSDLPLQTEQQGIYDFYLFNIPTNNGNYVFHHVIFKEAVSFEGPFSEADLYIRGDFNDWAAPAEHQLTYQGDNIYSVDIALEAATIQFKVADDAWNIYNFGVTGGAAATIGDSTTLVNAADSGNISLSVSTAGTYRFQLDASNTASPVVSVNAQ